MSSTRSTLITFPHIMGLLCKFLVGKLLFPKLRLRSKLLIFLLMFASGVALVDQRWLQSETFEALVRIDPLPHARELVIQERYAEAHEYLSFFMDYEYVNSNPESMKLYQEIEAKRRNVRYRLQKAAEGAIFGKSDELEGKISAVAVDFFVIGDIRDLTLEGMKWMNGEDVDEFTAALSTIGLVASVGSWISAGTSLSAKPALSFLKVADKSDDVPKWMKKELIRSAKLLRKTKNLDNVTDLLDSTHTLLKTSGVRGTLVLLDKAEDAKSLKALTKFGKTFGKRSATLLELSGDTGLAVFKRMDDVPKTLFLEAATYGEQGIKTLQDVGPDKFLRFLRTTKFLARTTKVSYKHHELLLGISLKVLRNSFGLLPTWLLAGIVAYGGILLLRR